MARYKKDVNIQTVALEAGVSVTTVSRVINQHTDVSEELRRHIQEVMDRVNFIPNRGREWVPNIGVVVSPESPLLAEYAARVIDGMTEYAGGHSLDMSVIMNYHPDSGKPLLRMIRERRCDGVVLLMCDELRPELETLKSARLPVMAVNAPYCGETCGFINNESYAGARQIVEYLIGLRHRAIGVVCARMEHSDNHQQRLKAYRDAMAAAGITVNEAQIVQHTPTELGQTAGYQQALQLFGRCPDVTAIFAMNDEMAMGVLKACWDTGRRVPDDISVVGFDGLPIGEFFHPALTTVKQPLTRIGYLAIQYLNEFLKGDISQLPGLTLQTELSIRESAAPPNQKYITKVNNNPT